MGDILGHMEIPSQIGQQIPQIQGVNTGKFDVKKAWPYVVGIIVVVLAGIGTAWIISNRIMGKVAGSSSAPAGVKVTSNEAGILDPNIKYQEVTGTLKEGGIGNEGTHHLERDGGPSQTVYLTSSVIDLSGFVDKKVEIWGETLAAKKAGWLMDVAKVKVSN
jgi:hypothetical protein